MGTFRSSLISIFLALAILPSFVIAEGGDPELVKRLVLENCEEALKEAIKLQEKEKKELISFLRRVLKLKSQNISASLVQVPKVVPLSKPQDFELSGVLEPDHDIQAKSCALQLLPSLLPHSLEALPEVVNLLKEKLLTPEFLTKCGTTAITLVSYPDLHGMYVSEELLQDLLIISRGESCQVAQEILLLLQHRSIPYGVRCIVQEGCSLKKESLDWLDYAFLKDKELKPTLFTKDIWISMLNALNKQSQEGQKILLEGLKIFLGSNPKNMADLFPLWDKATLSIKPSLLALFSFPHDTLLQEDQKTFNLLNESLFSEYLPLQLQAIYGLGFRYKKGEEVLTAFHRVLKGKALKEDPYVRDRIMLAMAHTLKNLGLGAASYRMVPVLIQALSISTLDIKDYIPFPIYENSKIPVDDCLSEPAAFVLAQIGSEAISSLVKALKDKNLSSKKQIVCILGHIQPTRSVVIASLSELGKDTDGGVREEVVRALNRLSTH